MSLRVYLDQNKWIELSAAAQGKAGFEHLDDVLLVARHGVEHGLVSFPLSSIHYMETWGTKPWRQRQPLATIMAELSRFLTIAGHEEVLAMELDRALQERFGRPTNIRAVDLFGYGVAHAFGKANLGLRDRLSPEIRAAIDEHPSLGRTIDDIGEFSALAGPPRDLPVVGIDTTSHKVFGDRFAEGERSLASRLREQGFAKGRLPRALVASVFLDILDPVNDAFARAGISAAELDTRDAITDFVMSLPSMHVAYEMRRIRHRNPQQSWKPNDLNDIAALSIAIPDCEVVVTERHWRGVLTDAHLDTRYGTAILDDLCELPAHIVAVQT